MRYAQHRSSMRGSRSGSSNRVWIVVFGILIVIIIILIIVLAGRGKEDEDVVEDEVPQETMEPTENSDPVSDEGSAQSISFEEVDIYHDGTRLPAGFARRGTEDGTFVHVMVADIPAIDPAIHYYEGWLVKPGITEYFSTGSLFAREDGKFGLIYEVSLDDAPEDIFDYSRVVVTRELFDGDSSPSPAHIAEGEFEM